jgi:hypothetical protein
MESLVAYIGVAGSAVSMLTTMYFWIVRVRKEQPCLKPYLADTETFLGLSRDGIRQIGLKIGFIVVNQSILPNVILGARVSVRLKEGWQEVGNLAFDKQSPQPFNLTPLQAVLLRLTGTLTFPYVDALEGSSAAATKYLDAFIADPRQIKLELRHLNKRVDIYVMNVTPDKGKDTRGIRPLTNAA